MRFGIMEMQLGALVPPPEVSTMEGATTHLAGLDHIKIVKQLFSAGFNLIELAGDLVLFIPHSFTPDRMEKLVAFKEENDIQFTVHLPLWSVEASTLLQPVRKGSLQALIEMIEATELAEPEVYVLHATGDLAAEFYQMRLPDQAKAFVLRQFQHNAAESLKTILGETGVPGRKIAIETIEFPFDLTMELAEKFDLSLCLDIGHVLSGFSGPLDFFDVLEQCLPRLGEIHLHDSSQHNPERRVIYGEDHQALGKGELDVPRLLDRLEEAGFGGPVIFELTVEEALASLEVIRSIRPHVL